MSKKKPKRSLEEFTELMASEGPKWMTDPDTIIDEARKAAEVGHFIATGEKVKLTLANDGKHIFRPLKLEDN